MTNNSVHIFKMTSQFQETKCALMRVVVPLGDGFDSCLLYNVMNLCPQFFKHSIRSNPLNLFIHGILQARMLECIAFPFSRGSSHPRDRTQVLCTAGRFSTSWATREAQNSGLVIPVTTRKSVSDS